MSTIIFFRLFAVLALILSLASTAFALDATQAVRGNVTLKSPVPTGTVATWPMDAAVPPGWLACTYSTSGGAISGYTNAVGQTTEATGGSETAPMHTLVKYIIKAD